jgi:predicted PolB exonuclease-like 3'-5' exonuclease
VSSASYLVLDIETVPDRDLYAPPEAASGGDRPMPPLYACRPIVIGVLWLGEDLGLKRLGTFGEGKDEAGMMTDFADFMGKWRPTLVTWNGRGFDLPVLGLRALRHGLNFGWYYRNKDARYRFSEEGHFDLCDALADHGAARMTSLDGAARLIGLPGKDGVDGSQVEGLYLAGQVEALRRYCLSDVAQTAFLFLRYRLLTGDITRDVYAFAATRLLADLEKDGRFGSLVAGVDRRRLCLDEGLRLADPQEWLPLAAPSPTEGHARGDVLPLEGSESPPPDDGAGAATGPLEELARVDEI